MRKLLTAAMAAGLLAVTAPAFAGDDGSSETGNELSCGTSALGTPNVGGTQVNAFGDPSKPSGMLVLCSDGSPKLAPQAPDTIQGRIIVSGDRTGGYLAADGDKTNPSTEADGWARVDFKTNGTPPTVKCQGETPTSSTNSESPTGSGACG